MSATTKTVNVPFTVTHSDGPEGFAYVNDVDGLSCYAPSVERAASKLKGFLAQRVQDALKHMEQIRRHVIGCGDGTVLFVSYQYGSWGYVICGPDRNSACSNSCADTIEKAIERAKDHAVQCYGGVAWDHSA